MNHASTDGSRQETAVIVEVSQHVATLAFGRPSRLNSMTPQSIADTIVALEHLDADEDVRVVVLTGSGRAFSAGGDIDALASGPLTTELIRGSVRLSEVLYRMRAVTIAAVNGPCAGGGMAVACAADLRLAGESAFFLPSFLRIGTTGDMGLPWHLARLLGESKAREISLLDERLPAQEAKRIGLVSRVIADDQLMTAAADLAGVLAARAPGALRGMKQNLLDAGRLDLAAFLDAESRRFAANSSSADATEAARAFIEHRPPNFENR